MSSYVAGPTHKGRHASDGDDPLSPADIGAAAAEQNLADLADADAARSNLGLGSAAVADVGTGDDEVATNAHNSATYVSGTVGDTAPTDASKVWVDTSGQAFAPMAALREISEDISVPADTWTALTWSSGLWNSFAYDDSNGAFNTDGTSTFEIPVAGRWVAECTIMIPASAAGFAELQIYDPDNGNIFGRDQATLPNNSNTYQTTLNARTQPGDFPAGMKLAAQIRISGYDSMPITLSHTNAGWRQRWFYIARVS